MYNNATKKQRVKDVANDICGVLFTIIFISAIHTIANVFVSIQ